MAEDAVPQMDDPFSATDPDDVSEGQQTGTEGQFQVDSGQT
jgi:hypothetical protein